MKAIGMKNSLIFSVYILEAMLLGIFGTKYLEANPFYCPIYKDYFSARFYTYLLYDASMITVIVVVLAAMYPAIIASRTNIIKAIWGG